MNKHITLILTALFAPCAFAHVTLEQGNAPAGSTYKAVFRVSHGCEGSPTRAITVFIPEGTTEAKPMPKAGWQLETRQEKLAQPYYVHGKPISERVVAVKWHGGRLLDNEYDEFIVRMALPAEPGVMRYRVLQECEKGQTDWSQAPTLEQPSPPHPAAKLNVLPADGGGAHHH